MTVINKKSRFIIVLGMHRSGTSSLAGSLQQCGLYLGDVHEWNPHNLKGNRENQQVMSLNDEILSFNESAWNTPPLTGLRWSLDLANQRDQFLQTLSAGKIGAVGFKDPRALLTFEFWRAANVDFQPVGTFRHPLAVANSLYARSGMSIDVGLSLWAIYNEKLLELLSYRSCSMPIVCFDVASGVYQADVASLAVLLGLKDQHGSVSQIEPFFEKSLRQQKALVSHAVGYDDVLLGRCLRIYQQLYAYYAAQDFVHVL